MQLDAKGAVPALSCMRRRNCVRDTHLFRAKSACKWAFLIPGIIEVSHSIDYHLQALPSAPLFGREIESCLTQSDASQSVHGGATAVKQRISFKSLNSNYITSRALRTSSCEHSTLATSLKSHYLKPQTWSTLSSFTSTPRMMPSPSASSSPSSKRRARSTATTRGPLAGE